MSQLTPHQEARRLAALRRYEVLDTPFEAAFDRVTQLASVFFGAPIALVSLIEHDRQWFKACYGLSLRQSERELSFCAYTLHSDALLVVPDAKRDGRFEANPLVVGSPGIRFYAGAPLQTPDGYNLGALCVIDTEPRAPLVAEQETILKHLAAMVIDELELRRTAAALQRSKQQLEQRVKARTAELERTKRELEEANAQLLLDAFRDKLTGLANRTLFMDHLSQAAERRAREGGGYAVLFMDLDRFKIVNDSLGHDVGDLLLIAFSERLKRCVRPGDTVARLGGDEFTILLEDISARDAAILTAERIQEELDKPFSVRGHALYISASIGIATDELSRGEIGELVRDADTAMYHAKARGKATHQVFDAALRERALSRSSLENDLRRALVQGELRVHYQPVVAIRTGQVVGVEALLRWHHPKRGLVLPAQFIPIAQETGLIVEIDRWVLRAACRQSQRWQERGGLTLSVNFSGQSFARSDLLEVLSEVFRETHFDPHLLRLELSETALTQRSPQAERLFEAITSLGVRIDLDDFGTGYSSLAHLQQFSLHALKIDRSFVNGVSERAEDAGLVKTVVAVAHSLDLQVVAEGVETEAQLEQLKALRCELGQGSLFAPPLSADDLLSLLSSLSPEGRLRS